MQDFTTYHALVTSFRAMLGDMPDYIEMIKVQTRIQLALPFFRRHTFMNKMPRTDDRVKKKIDVFLAPVLMIVFSLMLPLMLLNMLMAIVIDAFEEVKTRVLACYIGFNGMMDGIMDGMIDGMTDGMMMDGMMDGMTDAMVDGMTDRMVDGMMDGMTDGMMDYMMMDGMVGCHDGLCD